MVFPMYHAVIQVHGCFWHGHDCHLFKWPSTRQDFWKAKITGNRARDARNLASLGELGWRTLIIWECALKGSTRLQIDEVLTDASCWLKSVAGAGNITGKLDT